MTEILRRPAWPCIRMAFCMALLAMLGACASLDVKSNYQPPRDEPIENAIVVQKPFDRTWDGFVRKLSQSFFEVNTISKESRLISITVKGPRANEFFDCGRLTYTVNGKPWTFEPGEEAEFHDGGFPSETTVRHLVSSTGTRMNIFVAPEGAGTLFEVNSTYSLTMKQQGQSVVKNLLGQVTSRDRMATLTAGFSFTTRTADEQFLGDTKITCQATGVWEKLILDLARS